MEDILLQQKGTGVIEEAITRAMDMKSPLYLPVIATKPCFIKMASLVQAMTAAEIPFLLANSNQHYDQFLTAQINEFGYKEQIAVNLYSHGHDFNERVAAMSQSVTAFLKMMKAYAGKPAIVPMISGDTFSAGILPQLFYFSTGIRSVHIEAGLRSYGPSKERWLEQDFMCQAEWDWNCYVNDPFPEGMDSRLATVASELLFAPVERNRQNLLQEGYCAADIKTTGSLSSDAVQLIRRHNEIELFLERYPFITRGKWLRVDLHRRENLVPDKLTAVLDGMAKLSRAGMNILLVKSNAMMAAIRYFGLEKHLQHAEAAGVIVCELWPSYFDVVSFMLSEYCLGLYTDSGGLQEEAHILGVPCLTLRFSTDRPETVLDAPGNLLLPPVSKEFIYKNVLHAFSKDPWVGRKERNGRKNIYGNHVAETMVAKLKNFYAEASFVQRTFKY